MSNIPLSIINLRTNKEIAYATHQTFINKNPDFQREYEAWDDKLKTRFIETIIIGRAMNPIWTILNPDDNSEEILDGMHRITTALDFLNNKFKLIGKHFTDESRGQAFDKKCFSELSCDDQSRIRNYNFMFNQLDSSYRTNVNKRRDQYEILNRSSKTLNDYEFNKVLYNPFFDLISLYKNDLNVLFFNKKDKRGEVETEIIDIIVLSNEIPKSWSSITVLREKFYEKNLGETEESVLEYLKNNQEKMKSNLIFMKKIIECLKDNKFFSEDKRTFNTFYLPYKIIISRLLYKFKDIATFNRHIIPIIHKLKEEIPQFIAQYSKTRNAIFQKNLVQNIDEIIHKSFEENMEKRLFSKKDIQRKLEEQGNVCNFCKETKEKYEGDHIIPWSTGGTTTYDNLQVLCKHCHYSKKE
jgi:5-methylcytosine-specific restriction endonuclease McrA